MPQLYLNIVNAIGAQELWREKNVLMAHEGGTDAVQLWEHVFGHGLKLGPILGRDTVPYLQVHPWSIWE